VAALLHRLRHASRELGPGPLAADWVRGGIALYGSAPDHPEHRSTDWELQPAMTLASRLIAIQELQAGDTVGYGSTYTAARPMRIGIVACGYADGYPRHAPGGQEFGAPVLVRGLRTRLVGRVSMDMLAVDLGPAEASGQRCQIGDEVVLWGRSQHGTTLAADEVAQAASTIAYELLCAVAQRVPFLVEDSDAPQPRLQAS
jgi:alanine racemase